MSDASSTGVRFEEAIAYLKGKLPESSLAWDDLAGPVHAKVFTVAGSISADLSRDIQASLVKALEQGQTLSSFRKDFDQVVKDHGWSYNGSRSWRTSLIFNTNMRSAAMAGRWAQITANKARRPYLQYRTAGDARVRPLHRLWNGIIRPVDDPFWRTHYPPNGWNCRCTVRSYSDFEIQEQNLVVEKTPYKAVYRDVANKEGVITDSVPIGIDPGWDHNVGQSWVSPELALGGKLATLPSALRGPVTDKTISPAFQQVISDNWKAFRSTLKAQEKPKPQNNIQVLGFLDSGLMQAIQSNLPDVKLQSSAIVAMDADVWHLEGTHKTAPAAGQAPTRNHRSGKQVWPADWVDGLPMDLRSYTAVLWDAAHESLVVIPQGQFNDTVPRIVIRLNQKTKVGMACRIVSLGSTSARNLSGGDLKLLLGKVPE